MVNQLTEIYMFFMIEYEIIIVIIVKKKKKKNKDPIEIKRMNDVRQKKRLLYYHPIEKYLTSNYLK